MAGGKENNKNGWKNFCTNDSSRPKAFNGKGFAFHMRRPQSSSSSAADAEATLATSWSTGSAAGGLCRDTSLELVRRGRQPLVLVRPPLCGLGAEVFLILFVVTIAVAAARGSLEATEGVDDLRVFIVFVGVVPLITAVVVDVVLASPLLVDDPG